jgi:hypothetical protein
VAIHFQYSLNFEIGLGRPPPKANCTHSFVNAPVSIVLSFPILAILLYKTIGRDRERSGADIDSVDGGEWKFMHGDVYRLPPDAAGLSVRLGWGSQLVVVVACLLVLGTDILGYARLTDLSSVIDSFVNGFVAAAPLGGFVAGKIFKTIGVADWKQMAVRSSYQFVLVNCAGLYLLYLFPLRLAESSAGFPWLYALGFVLVNSLFGFVGILVGLKSSPIELSQKVNQLPRQIPPGGIFQSPLLIGGIVGLYLFVTILGPFPHLMVSAWTGAMPSVDLRALMATFVSAIVQAMLAGVVGTFWQLSKEDY